MLGTGGHDTLGLMEYNPRVKPGLYLKSTLGFSIWDSVYFNVFLHSASLLYHAHLALLPDGSGSDIIIIIVVFAVDISMRCLCEVNPGFTRLPHIH